MKNKKLAICVILISFLLILIIYSSLEKNTINPDVNYVLENFEQFINSDISFSGEIINVDTNNKTIEVIVNEPEKTILKVIVKRIEGKPKKGDIIEVFGTITSKTNINALNILISERWKFDLIYIRSLPAIPFALYLFFRTWKFNRKKICFERRKK